MHRHTDSAVASVAMVVERGWGGGGGERPGTHGYGTGANSFPSLVVPLYLHMPFPPSQESSHTEYPRFSLQELEMGNVESGIRRACCGGVGVRDSP